MKRKEALSELLKIGLYFLIGYPLSFLITPLFSIIPSAWSTIILIAFLCYSIYLNNFYDVFKNRKTMFAQINLAFVFIVLSSLFWFLVFESLI